MKKLNSPDPEQPQHELLLNKLLGFRFIGVLIAIGIVVIALSKFTSTISDLAEALPERTASTSTFDTRTQEQALAVAMRIDELCSLLIESSGASYAHFSNSYRQISAELNGLLLRQQGRPLNQCSIEQQRLVIENFDWLRENHKSQGETSTAFVQEVRKLFHQMFQKIIYLESSKPQN